MKLKELAGTNKEDTTIRVIFLSRLPEKWQQVLAVVSDDQFLEKLAVAADKMADMISGDIHIASIQTRESRSKTESLVEVMQYCSKISEKLNTLIDIVKDGFAPVSPVLGRNYSTARDGQRHFVLRDRGRWNGLLDTKNKKEHSMCHIH